MSEHEDNELEFDSPFGDDESGKKSRTRIGQDGAPLVPPPPPLRASRQQPDPLDDDEGGAYSLPSDDDLTQPGEASEDLDFSAAGGSDEHIGWKDNAPRDDYDSGYAERDAGDVQDRDVFALDAQTEAASLYEQDQGYVSGADGVELSDDSGEFLAKHRDPEDETTGRFDLPMTLEEASLRLEESERASRDVDAPPEFARRTPSEGESEDVTALTQHGGPVVTMSAPSAEDFDAQAPAHSSEDLPPQEDFLGASSDATGEEEKSWIQRASEQTQTNVLAFPLENADGSESEDVAQDESLSMADARMHATPRDEDFRVSDEASPPEQSDSESAPPVGSWQSEGAGHDTSADSRSVEEWVAVIESRNTKTRLVKLTADEFSQAERQILENRVVHISSKVLVLDAVAISRQLPEEGTRRRRRSRAA